VARGLKTVAVRLADHEVQVERFLLHLLLA